MSDQTRLSPGFFNERETRVMSDAFTMAWHVVDAQHSPQAAGSGTILLRREIAAVILEFARHGIIDSGIMAQAAIDQVRAPVLEAR
jgi:hypothetical protein